MDEAQILREIATGRPVYARICTVKTVGDLSCDVSPVDDPSVVIPKVRLKAHLQGDKSIVVKPAIGSFVLIVMLSVTDAFIAMYDEADSIMIKVAGQSYSIDKDGFLIDLKDAKYELKNDQENLKSLLSDFVAEVSKITVTTGTGPSGTPINITALQQISNRITKLFK